MFTIREAKFSDLERVYQLVQQLVQHHIGQGSKSLLSIDGLGHYMRTGSIHGLLLINGYTDYDDKGRSSIIGCMLYHSDTSPSHGGQGVTLEQFYIEPAYRKQGLGRKMMHALSKKVYYSGGGYIKLVYQDGLGLEEIYTKMGWVNHTRSHDGLHLFELYGKDQVQRFLSQTILPSDKIHDTKVSQILLPTNQSVRTKCAGKADTSYPTLGKSDLSVLPTVTKLVHVSGTIKVIDSPESIDKDDSGIFEEPDELYSPLNSCRFVEQFSVCTWLGPMLTVSDFSGNMAVLTADVIQERVRQSCKLFPDICGVVWEVPCGVAAVRSADYMGKIISHPDVSKLKDHLLATSLLEANVADDTLREGWNIAYLDRDGMRRLMKLPEL